MIERPVDLLLAYLPSAADVGNFLSLLAVPALVAWPFIMLFMIHSARVNTEDDDRSW